MKMILRNASISDKNHYNYQLVLGIYLIKIIVASIFSLEIVTRFCKLEYHSVPRRQADNPGKATLVGTGESGACPQSLFYSTTL